MAYILNAACLCNTGKVRKNNEDNFYFDGKCLESDNDGLKNPAFYEDRLRSGFCVSVFDGMGGENFGEVAAFTAAREMQQMEREFADFFISERKYLNRLVTRINNAVVSAQKELLTGHMGSTMVVLYFTAHHVYSCNLGDSRAYRLRDGEFLQISHDHVDSRPRKGGKKAPLTQHLGIDPEEMLIEPYIAKGELRRGDQYLLCSDGLTDMVSNFEIADILLETEDVETCVRKLIDTALEHGGRDNVTAIVCRID